VVYDIMLPAVLYFYNLSRARGAFTQRYSPGNEISVHFGPTIRKADILVFNDLSSSFKYKQ